MAYKPNSQDYDFMKQVSQVATGSGCDRPGRRYGAVIVRDGKIISSGANTSPGKVPTCIEMGGCIRTVRNIPSGTMLEVAYCMCAEQNAIATAAKNGVSTKDTVMYTTARPCPICTRNIIQSGIIRVIYAEDYPNELGLEIAKLAGLEMIKIDMK